MKADTVARCKPEYRNLLAFVLRYNEGARKMFRYLINLGATNMRPDYMWGARHMCKCGCGNSHSDRLPDPGVWYAECRGGLFVAMIRHSDGEWLLHS